MKTEPVIPLEQIRQHINENYDVHIQTLEFLPVGEGAWCFRGKGDTSLFIRLVQDPLAEEKATSVSKFLHGKGLPVLAPLPDKSGNLISFIDGSGLSVYPFIHGSTLMDLMESTFTDEDASPLRKETGAFVACLHRIDRTKYAKLALPTEDFSRFQDESIAIIRMDNRQQSYPLIGELCHFLSVWRRELESLIAATQKLARMLRSEKLDYVLCHGDIHEANVLVSREGERFIIDWDNVILAPKERDLMFFYGNALLDYLDGYFGHDVPRSINQAVVDYYVLEWALQEIVDYGTRILFDTRFDRDGRIDAWQQFQGLFEPGGDVEMAFALIRKMEI